MPNASMNVRSARGSTVSHDEAYAFGSGEDEQAEVSMLNLTNPAVS